MDDDPVVFTPDQRRLFRRVADVVTAHPKRLSEAGRWLDTVVVQERFQETRRRWLSEARHRRELARIHGREVGRLWMLASTEDRISQAREMRREKAEARQPDNLQILDAAQYALRCEPPNYDALRPDIAERQAWRVLLVAWLLTDPRDLDTLVPTVSQMQAWAWGEHHLEFLGDWPDGDMQPISRSYGRVALLDPYLSQWEQLVHRALEFLEDNALLSVRTPPATSAVPIAHEFRFAATRFERLAERVEVHPDPDSCDDLWGAESDQLQVDAGRLILEAMRDGFLVIKPDPDRYSAAAIEILERDFQRARLEGNEVPGWFCELFNTALRLSDLDPEDSTSAFDTHLRSWLPDDPQRGKLEWLEFAHIQRQRGQSMRALADQIDPRDAKDAPFQEAMDGLMATLEKLKEAAKNDIAETAQLAADKEEALQAKMEEMARAHQWELEKVLKSSSRVLLSPGEQAQALGLSGNHTRKLQVTADIRQKAVDLGILKERDIEAKGRWTYVRLDAWQPVIAIWRELRKKHQADSTASSAFRKIPVPSRYGTYRFYCDECFSQDQLDTPEVPLCPKCQIPMKPHDTKCAK